MCKAAAHTLSWARFLHFVLIPGISSSHLGSVSMARPLEVIGSVSPPAPPAPAPGSRPVQSPGCRTASSQPINTPTFCIYFFLCLLLLGRSPCLPDCEDSAKHTPHPASGPQHGKGLLG